MSIPLEVLNDLLEPEIEYHSEKLYPSAIQIEISKLWKMKLAYTHQQVLLMHERLNLNLLITEAQVDQIFGVAIRKETKEKEGINHPPNQAATRASSFHPSLPLVDRIGSGEGLVQDMPRMHRILPSGPIELEEARKKIANITLQIEKLEANIQFLTLKIEKLEKLQKIALSKKGEPIPDFFALDTYQRIGSTPTIEAQVGVPASGSQQNFSFDRDSKENGERREKERANNDFHLAPPSAAQTPKMGSSEGVQSPQAQGVNNVHSTFTQVIFKYQGVQKPMETEVGPVIVDAVSNPVEGNPLELQSPRKNIVG
jgi:hypothetical protein